MMPNVNLQLGHGLGNTAADGKSSKDNPCNQNHSLASIDITESGKSHGKTYLVLELY